MIFFAVSGFCLANVEVRDSFPVWYLKRIIRIYPAIWIVNILTLLIGYRKVESVWDCVYMFLFPTKYPFVTAIMLLYVAMFVLMWLRARYGVKIVWMMAGVFVLYLGVYLMGYDRSYYHINITSEWIIGFLYMEAMLTGSCFREAMDKGRIRGGLIGRARGIIVLLILFAVYTGSVVVFSGGYFLDLQILNHVLLLLLLEWLFYLLCCWEVSKDNGNENYKLERVVKALSRMTLEIYLVQYPVFYFLPDMAFPFNFIVVTALILIAATMVHCIVEKVTGMLLKQLKQQLMQK